MEKVKFFSISSNSLSIKHPDYSKLEKEINEFVSDEKIKILDMQYRLETTRPGSSVLVGVMIRYEEI